MTCRLTFNLLLDTPFATAGPRFEMELQKLVDNGLCCRYSGYIAARDSSQVASSNKNPNEEKTMSLSMKLTAIVTLDATWPANKSRTDAQLFALAQRIIAGEC